MKRQRLGVLGFVLTLTLLGCGSGDGGTSTNTASVQASCNAYCTALIAKACTLPIYASVTECKAMECQPLSAAPAKCNAALKVDYDCRAAQVDICTDEGCATQDAAIFACASGG